MRKVWLAIAGISVISILGTVYSFLSNQKEQAFGFGVDTVSIVQGRFTSSTLAQIIGLDKNAVQLRVIATSSQIGNVQNWESPTSTIAYITNNGDFRASGTLYGVGLSISGTGTTTFSGGIEATLLNITSNTATSTFANGIQLNGGCFRDNTGSCVGGASGANTALSNLVAVAVNTSLVSDTNNTDDLGSAAIGWKDVYASGTLYIGTSILSRANGIANLGAFGTAFNNILASGTIRGADLILSGTGTSTSNGGLSLTHLLSSGGLTITGSNTSTFTNGIQLSAGCFRDSTGSCVGDGAAASSPFLNCNSGFLSHPASSNSLRHIAHGLSKVPNYIRITAMRTSNATPGLPYYQGFFSYSVGVNYGAGTSSKLISGNLDGGPATQDNTAATSTSYILYMDQGNAAQDIAGRAELHDKSATQIMLKFDDGGPRTKELLWEACE